MNLLHKSLVASTLAYAVFFPAYAQQLTCIPASTAAVTGASNPNGKWFAYRCGAKTEIVACTTDHCTDAVVNAVWWVVERGVLLTDANSALKKYGAVSQCDPAIKNVWWNDRAKIQTKFKMTADQVAAICPTK